MEMVEIQTKAMERKKVCMNEFREIEPVSVGDKTDLTTEVKNDKTSSAAPAAKEGKQKER
jgi:hypothetical protein